MEGGYWTWGPALSFLMSCGCHGSSSHGPFKMEDGGSQTILSYYSKKDHRNETLTHYERWIALGWNEVNTEKSCWAFHAHQEFSFIHLANTECQFSTAYKTEPPCADNHTTDAIRAIEVVCTRCSESPQKKVGNLECSNVLCYWWVTNGKIRNKMIHACC